MEIFIVYDNEAIEPYIPSWGFSCYIKDFKLLFDTGWDGNILLHNLEVAGIKEIETVFLSHQHWDHIGGLTHIINSVDKVIVPKSFSQRLKNEISRKAEVIEVDEARDLGGFYSTGDLNGEQAAVFKVKDDLLVITGCAHPGVERIIDTASIFGEVKYIIGGFHGFSKISMLKNLNLVVPCHCTQKKREIEGLENSVKCYAGCKIKL